MEFSIRAVSARSVTIEINNSSNYYAGENYQIFLNGEAVKESCINATSLFGLEPDKEYSIYVRGEDEGKAVPMSFRTLKESALVSVKDFGARGDGKSNDTAKIQAAIDVCPSGGTVYFPKGSYLSGPLFLKSAINIWLEKGAVLLGDPDREHYPVLPGMVRGSDEKSEYPFGAWEGNPLDEFASLITGIGVSDVNIFGEGEINGNADNADWWENPKVKRTAWRPKTVFLCRSRNILIQGVTVRNSPSWTIHPYYSEELKLFNLKIRNPADSPNTDGINPESCKGVLILGADISVGDDCIAIKSGKYYMALKHHKPSEHITVRNCLLQRGHGSVTIGSECAGGVYHVRVSQCVFKETDRGLRIKTRRGRGQRAVIDDVFFEHISMQGVRMPFTVNMFYFCDPDGHSEYCQGKDPIPVDEMTPMIRLIRASDIDCTGAKACILCAYGLPEQKISELRLDNINASFGGLESSEPELPVMMDGLEPMLGKAVFIRNAGKVVLRNVQIEGALDPEPDFSGVDELAIDNFQ